MAFFPACRNAFRATRTLALACLLCLFAACAQAAAPVDKEFRAQLERVLKENPEIILDILKDNWQEIREEAMRLFDEGYIRAAEKDKEAAYEAQ